MGMVTTMLMLAATAVQPVFTNFNDIAGNTQVMVGLKEWSEQVVTTNTVTTYVADTAVTNKGAVAEAKAYVNAYTNQAPDYANVSNKAVNAVQYANIAHTAITVGERAVGSATGEYSVAMGVNATASDSATFSQGINCEATGLMSHAEGESTKATSAGSHAEGKYTEARGPYSHAEGEHAIATGECDYSSGWRTLAFGGYSRALGIYAVTKTNEFAAYTWNGVYKDSSTFYNSHGRGTYNINPVGGLSGFYIGETSLESAVVPWTADHDGDNTAIVVGTKIGSAGPRTMSVGYNNYITGTNAIAVGASNKSYGLYSATFGYGNEAYELSSIGIGYGNSLSAAHAIGIGFYCSADKENAIAMGNSAYAGKSDSFVWSALLRGATAAADGSFNIWAKNSWEGVYINGQSLGSKFGEFIRFSEDVSHGYSAITIGSRDSGSVGVYSWSMGLGNVAAGKYSYAHGDHCKAYGEGAISRGYYAVASNKYAVAEGHITEASGFASHAEGNSTKAYGGYSHAEGLYSEAREQASHAEGGWAIATNKSAYVWNGGPYSPMEYYSHGNGTYSINPVGGLSGFYIGETNLVDHIDAEINPQNVLKAIKAMDETQKSELKTALGL